MSFIVSEETKSLVDMVDDFLTKEMDPIVEEYEAKAQFPQQVFDKCVEMGLHMMPIPEEMGGIGLDELSELAIMQVMAKHDCAITFTLTNTSTMLGSILQIGTPEQKKKYLKIVAEGGMLGFCLTEPTGSSDAATMRTSAVRDGDDYIINGTKTFITSGGLASAYVVVTVTDKTAGAHGITSFLVDADNPGVQAGRHENKLGMRMSPTTEVAFTDCRVPASAMLGKEGMGFIMAMAGLDAARLSTGAIALGLAQRALEETVKYTSTRIVSGKPIYKNQYVSFKLAEYAARLESCEALIEHTIEIKKTGKRSSKEAAMAKLLCTDLATELASDAVQFHGGYGVCTDYPVEKIYRDAKILQIVEGANEIQKLVISRAIAKEYAG